uniref:Uncharacterized protein n=1 Tax=Aegilops tauschii subsp. strangulata TaxID=200361 RepID=A0A453GI77_AEGTS
MAMHVGAVYFLGGILVYSVLALLPSPMVQAASETSDPFNSCQGLITKF